MMGLDHAIGLLGQKLKKIAKEYNVIIFSEYTINIRITRLREKFAFNKIVYHFNYSAMYWSVLALTTIGLSFYRKITINLKFNYLSILGDLPRPRTKSEYSFLIMEIIFALFLFASL